MTESLVAGCRVLVADDSPFALELIKAILGKAGCTQLIGAGGGREALVLAGESRFDVVRGGAGAMTVAGVAWYQHVGIAGVDVSVDGGPWQAATLAEAISVDTWVQWRYDFAPSAGDHTLRVRAHGSDGTVQTGAVADVVPDGATGYHTVQVTAA